MLIIVNENRLDEWVRANARDAQELIVDLVWRLVAASCPKPRERRFPLADSIEQHGPDGILDTVLGFDPFVPEGRSFWEIGTGLRAGDKATEDYNSLTATIPEPVRKDSTFVFVTPLSARRDWEYTWKKDAQARWIEERRSRGEWKDVRVIDGTKLIEWVHHFPAIELWLAGKIIPGLPAQQIETLEQRWDILKSAGEPPPLTPDVFLANRSEACEKLRELLDGTITQLKLTTHFPDQVADFVSAYVASLDVEAQKEAVSCCLIVKGVDAWGALCKCSNKLILIADASLNLVGETGARLIEQALSARHAVVFGGPQGGIPEQTSVPLRNPSRYQVQQALQKAGYTQRRARTLAYKSDGNLGLLLRCIRNLSPLLEWAQSSDAADLAIALLLGSWRDSSEADRKIASDLAGGPYKEWIGKMREIALRPGTPLIQQEGNWKFISRYEGWYALGPRLFDEHLDQFKTIAVSVLQEPDPQFELEPDKRYMASIYGKVLKHSHQLRNGIAESLALLGSHPKALTSCSSQKAETTAILAVREILSNADWVRWASLNDLLPLLAEAAPSEFLDAVEKAMQKDPCPFDELFAQERGGITGRTYISGLLWALETLAWDANYLSRAVLCLGELATRDPGGSWANRPANSLTTILLPWLPQTCAPISQRVAAVKALLAEHPAIGWKLLLSLLSKHFSSSLYTRRPVWRPTIPDDWRERVTDGEYWEQITNYAKLALNEAKKDVWKLIELINYLPTLPQSVHEKLLEHLASDEVLTLSEGDRLRLWNALVGLVTTHRKFADADWAMKFEQVNRIAAIAEQLAPQAPFFRHQRLFSENEFDLYEEKSNYEKQMKDLEVRRQKAVEEVAAAGGIPAVIAFAKEVQSPWRVGIAFGAVASPDADAEILPKLLESDEQSLTQFVGGFVRGRFGHKGWPWVDSIDTSSWSPEQIRRFLSFLPFTSYTWERAERLLGEQERLYWTNTTINPYEAEGNLQQAVDRLLKYGRPDAAILCLYRMLHDRQPFDNKKAAYALLGALKSSEIRESINAYKIVEIIKALQEDPATDPEDLFKVEWAYLPLLDGHYGVFPQFLWKQLANDPQFFCELIKLAFRSKHEESPAEDVTEEKKNIATNAYRLLSSWKTPPGFREDGSYDGNALKEWLEVVKQQCTETGHLEIAMTMLGHVLIYAPPDPDGLWIHRSAAEVLNDKTANDMRDGFWAALYNSRGAYIVDPTGKPEKELANKYRKQANAVEEAGFARLADTLRKLADRYENEAQMIVSRYNLDE
jgi:hypothetical protein